MEAIATAANKRYNKLIKRTPNWAWITVCSVMAAIPLAAGLINGANLILTFSVAMIWGAFPLLLGWLAEHVINVSIWVTGMTLIVGYHLLKLLFIGSIIAGVVFGVIWLIVKLA